MWLNFIEVNEPHEGLRKTESQWPVHQINWQKSRYIYDLYYTYNRISREVYDYCIKNKIVDAALIAKWKKTGYERLCSTYTINARNYKFGTVSICRVPKQFLQPGTQIEDPTTGCHGCASGSGGEKNIFGNKYGQYLAAIQVAREDRLAAKQAEIEHRERAFNEKDGGDSDNEGGDDDGDITDDNASDAGDDDDEGGVVGAADGSSGKKASIWAAEGETVELPESVMGKLDADADNEAKAAIRTLNKGNSGNSHHQSGPAAKRTKTNDDVPNKYGPGI